MISYYQLQTQRLLQNPAAPTTLYSAADIDSYINIARGQLASDGRCIRRIGTISTTIGNQGPYNFSGITLGDASVSGVLHVRSIYAQVGSGLSRLNGRPWPWFQLYHLNNINPQNAPIFPGGVWTQYGQGSSGQGAITNVGAGSLSSGSFYVDPPPDLVYTLQCDCVCYPAELTADSDPESIPYQWTDAVPFFAAYYALLSSQSQARLADAERYYNYYETFVDRARNSANPDTNGWQFDQGKDPVQPLKIGAKAGA
jgi:hypothetical protein